MTHQTDALAQADINTLLHPTTNLATHPDRGPLILETASGVTVTDVNGKDYIEAMAGLWCTALGYGVEELVAVASEQMSKLSFGHMFGGRSHEPGIALAEKLADMVPIKNARVFFGNSGSDANDTQIKLQWYYNNCAGKPNKKKIIARKGGYHGVTLAAASLTGLPVNHGDFDLPLPGFLHTETPHHYRFADPGETEEAFSGRLASELEALIEAEGPETIAAFFAEPIIGAGGVLVPPKSYFPAIQAVLDRHDIMLVDDEVICGFHRTGNLFGAETEQMRPDTMSFAKALSSAYLPISAVVIPGEMYDTIVEGSKRNGAFGHGFTYSGHPVCAAVALETLRLMDAWNISGHVEQIAPVFQKRLGALQQHPLVGESRGKGLMGAIELVADKDTKARFSKPGAVALQCADFAQDAGLIVRNIGDTIALCPPLVIKEEEINAVFDRLSIALDKTLIWAESHGLRSN